MNTNTKAYARQLGAESLEWPLDEALRNSGYAAWSWQAREFCEGYSQARKAKDDLAVATAGLTKAVEFAHYLAKGAERFIEAVNARDEILVRIEDGDEVDGELEAALARAQEDVGEFARGLRSDVYEFRKRADRVAPAAAPVASAATGPAAPAVSPEATKSNPDKRAADGGTVEVPDYVPAERRGPGLVTYWLAYGEECVSTVRMPPGMGADDVRKEAAREAVVMCDRANGENPGDRRAKIMHSVVKVYDDRPGQERMRRELPFERRALFPNELPFLELVFRSPKAGIAARLTDVSAITLGLKSVALAEGLEMSVVNPEGAQRGVRVESADCEAIGRVEHALKGYLEASGAELVSEFGVGYARLDLAEAEAETETEHPRG